MNSKPGQTITEFDVAELEKIAFEIAASVETAVQGFRSTGIYPFGRNKFTDIDFLPSEVTNQEVAKVTQGDIDNDDQRFIFFNQDNDPPLQLCDLPSESQIPTIGSTLDEKNSNFLRSAEKPSSTGDSVPIIASPEDIIPLPRIKIKRKRSGRGLKSVLLTSASNKNNKKKRKLRAKRINY